MARAGLDAGYHAYGAFTALGSKRICYLML